MYFANQCYRMVSVPYTEWYKLSPLKMMEHELVAFGKVFVA